MMDKGDGGEGGGHSAGKGSDEGGGHSAGK